jgi:hypothetical protein
MSLSSNELALVESIVNGVSGRLEEKMKGIEKVFDEKNKNMCVQITTLQASCTDNGVEIAKIKNKLSYYLGKAAGVSVVFGALSAILVLILKIIVSG